MLSCQHRPLYIEANMEVVHSPESKRFSTTMVLQRHWTFSFSNNSRFVGRVLVSHYAFSQRYVQTLCDMLLKIARRKWECVTRDLYSACVCNCLFRSVFYNSAEFSFNLTTSDG